MTDLDKYDLGLTPDEADAFIAALHEARHGPDTPDPMDALRAEVEALLRDAEVNGYGDLGAGREFAYEQVLDLIDKHREGQ